MVASPVELSVFEGSVFDKARSAERLLGEVAAELDGDALDLEGAKRLVDVLTRCERFAEAARGIAARRVATGINWKHAGHRNSAEWLADATGVSVGEAARELETAKQARGAPCDRGGVPRPASCRGAQAAEIASSATVDPDAEAGAAGDRPRWRLVPCRARPVPRGGDARVRRRRPGAPPARHAQCAHVSGQRRAHSRSTPSSPPTSAPASCPCSRRRPTSCSAPHARPAPPSCVPPTRPTRSPRSSSATDPGPPPTSACTSTTPPPNAATRSPASAATSTASGPSPSRSRPAMLADAKVTLLRHDHDRRHHPRLLTDPHHPRPAAPLGRGDLPDLRPARLRQHLPPRDRPHHPARRRRPHREDQPLAALQPRPPPQDLPRLASHPAPRRHLGPPPTRRPPTPRPPTERPRHPKDPTRR